MKENFKLEDLPKRTIYQVPDGYFDKLPTIVMARVASGNTATESKWITPLLYSYRAVFASLLLLIGFVGTFYLSQNQQQNSTVAILPAFSSNDIIEYVSNRAEINSGDLAELTLTDTDISHEFYNVTTEEILQVVDDEQLEEVYYN